MIPGSKKFIPFILIFINCAATNHRWSRVSQPPESLTNADKGHEVILILKHKQQIKGIYLEKDIHLVVLQITDPKTGEKSLQSIQFNDIQGVLIKQEDHVNPVLMILATVTIAFVIAYYLAMKGIGDGLS